MKVSAKIPRFVHENIDILSTELKKRNIDIIAEKMQKIISKPVSF